MFFKIASVHLTESKDDAITAIKLVTLIIFWENECVSIMRKYYLAKHKSAKQT